MAYDRNIRKVVLFGGYNGSQYLGDTWLWDGATSTWTQAKPTHSPKATTGPMVFTDPSNGYADEFGGFDGRLYQNTTWRWMGKDWKQVITQTIPYARSAAVIALDPVHKNVVMFGGLADMNPNNTWTFDGTDWTMQSPTTQPTHIYSPGTAFDPRLQEVITFGGGVGGVDQNMTWAWDGSNWAQLSPVNNPPARENLGLVYDSAAKRLIMFGGINGNSLYHDTWRLVGQ